jgi:subtilisin family serine protease
MPAALATRSTLVTGLALLAIACSGAELEPGAADADGAGAVRQALESGLPRRVIVSLAPPAGAAAPDAAPAAGGDRAQQRLAGERAEAYGRAKAGILAALPPAEAKVVNAYRHLPVLHLELRTAGALARLLERPEVLGVQEDVLLEPFLAQSLSLIGQPLAATAGGTGEGTAVAVLDTGVDHRRPELGACAAPGAAGCRVVYSADVAPDDGALDAHGHGTNVAAIVAAVAPGAKLVALDVFDGQYARSSDVLAAIDWCIQHRETYGIVALNLSLGSGGASAPCGGDVFAGAAQAARAAGIAVVAAAGNSGHTGKIASPACAPAAVSVGAVYDANVGGLSWSGCADLSTVADQVACFSNSASFLTLLAPGAIVTAGGASMGGTSQAAPHVAGAVAVLRGLHPDETIDETIDRLRAAGRTVTDSRNGVSTPRLDLAAAVAGCSVELGAPPGAFGVAGGAAALAVTAPPGCAWTASSSAGWLSVSPARGTGSALLTLAALPNAGPARAAALSVGVRSVAATQAPRRPFPGRPP